jgi:transcriptional regulator with XRE-family HTH domain
MPRGSKPGERRGGRKTGTPNKKTLLRSAFIDAVAADPNLQPLDFFLRLMHQSTLTLDIRVRAAEAALPYMHARPRPTKKQDGDAQPRVKLRPKADADLSDLEELHLGPEFQDGDDECDDTDSAALQPGLTDPCAGESDLGEPSMRHDVAEPGLQQSDLEPVAQRSAAEPIVQQFSAALALPGPARVKPEGGEAWGAGTKTLRPLAFLRAVMRHPDTPVALRMKVASIIAPYLHPKAAPESETEYVVDDQYGFSVEPAQAKNLRDALEAKGSYLQPQDLIKRFELAKKSLRCPETYRWDDLAKDHRRLSQLAAKRKAQGLTPLEVAERFHLKARAFSHENSAEHAERERAKEQERLSQLAARRKAQSFTAPEVAEKIHFTARAFSHEKAEHAERKPWRDRFDALYAKWLDYSITEAEQEEFDVCRRANFRDGDGDPVGWHFYHQLWLEAKIRGQPSPTPYDAEKLLAAKRSSADIIRDPAKLPTEQQTSSEDVDFAAWLRGEARYPPWLLRKTAFARYGQYSDARIVPNLMVALVRDQAVVLEEELSPYHAWVLRIYDEANSA